ncbi:MAG: response regulator [Magnetovibrio sp.]|nr:response regulator [Magnetovibrio sp.]
MARILIIDDDQDILDFTTSCLESSHTVTTAMNGEEGMVACEKGHFDLILTDIFMPYRDGLDIIREVRTLYPSIKIIAMTSHVGEGMTDYLKAAELIGAHAKLEKPLTPEIVVECVDAVLNN